MTLFPNLPWASQSGTLLTQFNVLNITGGASISVDKTGQATLNVSGSGGGGTVTSVSATGSTGLAVSGSPITGTGTLTLTLGTELQGLAGLATNGFVQRTGTGTYIASNSSSALTYTAPFTSSVQESLVTKISERVSVKDFGAIGNGSTDDTTAVTNAIANAGNASIYFPAGTYLISSVTINKSITLYGDGIGSTTIKPKNAASDVFNVTTSQVIIRDMAFNFGPTQTGGSYIHLNTGSSVCILENLYLLDWYTGISATGSGTYTIRDVTLANGVPTSGTAINVTGAVGGIFTLDNVLVTNPATASLQPGNGLFFNGAGNVNINAINCSFFHCISGVSLLPGAGQVIADAQFINCYFDHNLTYGLLIAPSNASGAVVRTVFDTCWFGSTYGTGGVGLSVNGSTGTIDGIQLTNCNFVLNYVQGGYFSGVGTSNVKIIGGFVSGNGSGATSDGLVFDAVATTGLLIDGTAFSEWGSVASNTGFGLHILNGTASPWNVSNCYFNGNGGGAIAYPTTTGIVMSNNIGFTENFIPTQTQITVSGSGNALTLSSTASTTTLIVSDTGSNGANIELSGNGGTTPNKWIRAQNGALQIINSAYSASLFTLDDSGNITSSNWQGQPIVNTYLKYPQTAGEIAASVTPTNYYYEPGDVLRYGAVGDGVTSDTVAIQKAITVAQISGIPVQLIPGAKHYLSTGVTFKQGRNSSDTQSYSVWLEGNYATLYPGPGITAITIVPRCLLADVGTGRACASIHISDLTVDGGSSGGTGANALLVGVAGSFWDSLSWSVIRNFTVQNLTQVSGGVAVMLWEGRHCLFENINLRGGASLFIQASTTSSFVGDFVFDSSEFSGSSSQAPITITAGGGSTNSQARGIKFIGCDVYGGGSFIHATGSGSVGDIWFVSGCQFDQAAGTDVFMTVYNDSASAQLFDVHFNDGYYTGGTQAFYVHMVTGAGMKQIEIGSNVINSMNIASATLGGAAVLCLNANGISIHDNVFDLATGNGTSSAYINFDGTTNFMVNNNQATNATSMTYGVSYGNAVTKYSIIGNLMNCTTITNDYHTGSPVSQVVNNLAV